MAKQSTYNGIRTGRILVIGSSVAQEKMVTKALLDELDRLDPKSRESFLALGGVELRKAPPKNTAVYNHNYEPRRNKSDRRRDKENRWR